MTERWFRVTNFLIAAGFAAVFCTVVVPALLADRDILGGFAAGFVNPYAAGYSADVLFCWAALLVWVMYEARTLGVRHGWVCLLLGVVPGVAVGLSMYLALRTWQITQSPKSLTDASS